MIRRKPMDLCVGDCVRVMNPLTGEKTLADVLAMVRGKVLVKEVNAVSRWFLCGCRGGVVEVIDGPTIRTGLFHPRDRRSRKKR